MPVYSGSTKYPYALTINYNGVTSNAAAVSENIQPIVVDTTTQYQFISQFKVLATWSSGVTITVTYYNASNSVTGSVAATQSSMTGGTIYTLSTAAGVAPASTAYATLTVQLNGAPATTNTLSVLQAGLYNTNNTNIDYEINQNAAFANGIQPWVPGNNAMLSWSWTPLQVGDGNYDSLLISGAIELLGGFSGVPCDIPELIDSNGVGAMFRLLAPPSTNSVAFGYQGSYDLGAPQPTTDVVESLLLDGERPFGYRASNRTITLPILIEATSQALVQAAREYLMMLIDQQLWKLTWTSAATGLPLVFDCFRAQPTVIGYGFDYNRDPASSQQNGGLAYATMTLSFQAMPYGHSGIDGTKDLSFSSALVNGKAQAAAVTLDQLSSVGSNTAWTEDTRWNSLNYIFNNFEEGTNGTGITAGNSAPTSGDSYITAFSSVTIGSNASATYSNAQAAHGTLSANINTGSSATNVKLQYNTSFTNATQFFRVYCYFTGNPGSTNQNLLFVGNGATQVARLHINTSGTLGMDSNSASNVITTTNTVPLNQWVRIEGWVTGSASVGQLSMSLYSLMDSTNPLETQTSAANLNTAAIPNNWQFGATNTGNTSYSFYMDEIAVSGTARIGPWTSGNPTTQSTGAVGYAVHYAPARPIKQPYPNAVFTNNSLANLNLSGLTSLNYWFGQAYDYAYGHDPTFKSTVVFRWTLTDVNGRTLKFSKTFHALKWSKNSSSPAWKRISIPIPQGKIPFNYSNVTGYSVTFSNHSSGGLSGFIRMHAWLSNLQALPETITNTPGTPRANLFNVFGAPGSARSPISVQAQLPSSTSTIVKEFTKTGTWKVPQGVYSIQAECWGGGGAGSSYNAGSNFAGGGGGGGEYAAEPSIVVTPGTHIPYTIGSGGTAGQLVNTVNTYTDPGTGHWVCPANVTSIQVECWGGGAAGAAGGGGGGGGEYAKETTLTVVPGTSYTFRIGKGGVPNTGKSTGANGARNGQDTWFTAASKQVYANGGLSCTTGGSIGGTGGHGSSNATHHNGGKGGNSPGAAGGGGGGAGQQTVAGKSGNSGKRGTNAGQGAHLTGGDGGAGGGGGGAGGNGSNAPGFPGVGNGPGGGGGGGYNLSGKNYKGGTGAAGQVTVTYQVNLGSPVNGGGTSFGSSAVTSTTVFANGGLTVANNTAAGTTGGTGSNNSVHFDGGAGYPRSAPTEANGLITASSNNLTNLGKFNYTTASGTSSATSTSATFGTMVVCVTAASAVTDLVVTDNAGNTYEQQSSVAIGTATMYVFTAPVAAAIVNGTTTLTVTSATAQQYTVSWNWLANALEVNATNIATNTGTGTAATVTLGNTDATTTEFNLVFFGNNSTVTTTGGASGSDDATVFSSGATAGGTQEITAMVTTTPPNTSGRGSGGVTWGSSTTWGGISVPLVISNQGANPVSLMSVASQQSAAASTSYNFNPRFSFNTFGAGMIVLFVQRAGTSTITASDSGSNVYTARVTPSNGATTSYVTVLTAPVTADPVTITINDTVNQAHNTKAFYIPGAVSCDTAASATGTSTTSVALTTGTPAKPGDFTMFVGLTAGVAISSNLGTGTVGVSNTTNNSQTMFINSVFNVGTAAPSSTATTTASTAIGIGAVSLALSWWGGGGGASAGNLGVGWKGYDTGGISPGGGGLGATGPIATSAGIQGGAPGGGGSGAMSTSATVLGGSGGGGRVRITYTPPLQSFDNLILHMPGYDSPDTFNPVSPIPPTDPPDGREYVMQSLVPWRNAEFNGTYSVFLANYNWSHSVSTSTTRRITVTVTQYEYAGGPGYSMQVTRLVTPSTDIINGLISMGNLPLPIKQYDDSNAEPYYTYSIISSASGDRFMDVLFLDTTGETVLVNISNSHPGYGSYANFYVDEPDFDTDISPVLGSPQGPERAVSILDSAIMSGGPFFLVPGDNFILAYSTYGAPNIGVRYNPRWYTDRTVF